MRLTSRYEIRTGKFGQHFYDNEEDRDLPLADVLALLNDQEIHDYEKIIQALKKAGRVCSKDTVLHYSVEALAVERNALVADIERERASRIRYQEMAIGVQQALEKAGVELKTGHDNTLRWGVELLAARNTQLAADCINLRRRLESVAAERNALVADIERLAACKAPCPSCGGHIQRVNEEERVCYDCGHIFVDGNDDGLKTELAKYMDLAEQRAREIDALYATVDRLEAEKQDLVSRRDNLADKIARIVQTVPHSYVAEVVRITEEGLPPSDSTVVEVNRAAMLADIDDLLQKADCWVGGRRASLLELITQRQGMATSLKFIDKWMEDMGPTIKSWLVRP